MDSGTLRSPLAVLKSATPICVDIGTSLKQVIDTMKKQNIGCVCVVEHGQLIGIFTERDVLSKVIASGLDVHKIGVEKVMTPEPEYLFEEDQLAFALNRMHVGGFRHIPLVNLEGEPVGVVSVRDILRYLVEQIGN